MKKLTTDIIENIEELFPDVRIDIEENTNEIVIKFANGNSPIGVKVTISGDDMFTVCLWRYVKDTGSISTGEIVDMHYGSPEVKCRMNASEAGVFIAAKVVYFLSFC